MIDKYLKTYEKLSWKYVNTAEIITKVYDDPFFKLELDALLRVPRQSL